MNKRDYCELRMANGSVIRFKKSLAPFRSHCSSASFGFMVTDVREGEWAGMTEAERSACRAFTKAIIK